MTLYGVGEQGGVLVSGKPGATLLPPPFNQVPAIDGHEIHHKFVVCGFNADDPVVYCGSSNLAEGGEQEQRRQPAGHPRRRRRDRVRHRSAEPGRPLQLPRQPRQKDKTKAGAPAAAAPANKQQAAAAAGWFLLDHRPSGPTNTSTRNDLHYVDRRLFGDPLR